MNLGKTLLFFNWLKQHLSIKKFCCVSPTPVKAQIWCPIATNVLIVSVKKELKLKSSLYTGLQILSVSIFKKTLISCALEAEITKPINYTALTN